METQVVLLKIKDAATRMGVSRSAAYRLVDVGDLAVVDIARTGAKRPKLRVDIREIDRFATERQLKPLSA
jgi:predicted site-specific integrase-resolvase